MYPTAEKGRDCSQTVTLTVTKLNQPAGHGGDLVQSAISPQLKMQSAPALLLCCSPFSLLSRIGNRRKLYNEYYTGPLIV